MAVGDQAPAFVLPDLSGRQVDFQPVAPGGKLLAFYKNSCPTCHLAMPYIDRLARRLSAAGGVAFAISQDSASEAEGFANQYRLEMPQLVDARPHAVSRLYRLFNVPTVFLIDPAGQVVLASPAFVRADLEQAAVWIAREQGEVASAIFTPEDDVPDLKPG